MRGFWGDFTDGMRAEGQDARQAELLHLRRGLRRQRRADRQLHVGRQGREGLVRPVRLDVLLLAEVPRHRRGVRAATARPRTSSACYNSAHRAQPDATRGARRTATRPGPTISPPPHAASADGGIGLAPQQVLVNFLDNHDLPRFMFEKTDPSDAQGRARVPHDVGRHPVRLLRHRAGLRRRRRSEEPRGHVRRQPDAGLRAVRDRSATVQAASTA